MEKELSQALALQDDLLDLSQTLAALISVLPSRRDGPAIRAAWQAIDRHRSKLNAHLRKLRKLERDRRPARSRSATEEHRRLGKQVQILKKRLRLWDSMADLVERHIDPPRAELAMNRPENVCDPVLTMVYRALHRLANPQDQTESAREHGCFADIAMRIQPFECLMYAAYRLLSLQGRSGDVRFLDVGCGGGTKVFAASRFFGQCDGLEYDPAYAENGQRTLRMIDAENCRVFRGDGLTFDGYGNYDVIYFYRPMREDDRLIELENRIFSHARPGTVILAPYDAFLGPRSGLAQARIAGPVFVSGITQDDADALRAEAERTGTEMVRRSGDFQFDTGFWAPLLDAAQFNGTGA